MKNLNIAKQLPSLSRSTYTLRDWIAEAQISRSTWFNLPNDCKPERIKIGREWRILETSDAWYKRMAARGGVSSEELAHRSELEAA